MIRSLTLMLALLSAASFANYNPITEFPGGIYLGEGRYIISNGMKGTYASHANLNGDKWKLSYVRNGKPLLYGVSVSLNSLGFLNASIDGKNKNGEAVTYYGEGYCGSKQCHLSFELDDGEIEETITLLTNQQQIYRTGSLTFIDDNGDKQRVAWEELMHSTDNENNEKKPR